MLSIDQMQVYKWFCFGILVTAPQETAALCN